MFIRTLPQLARTRKWVFGPLHANTFSSRPMSRNTRVALGHNIIPTPTSRSDAALS
jgi:hypothetical protein